MSEETLELVRRAYEAWSRGDLEEMLEVLDADIEYSTARQRT